MPEDINANITITYNAKNIARVTEQTRVYNRTISEGNVLHRLYGDALTKVAMRFIGIQAVVGGIQRGFQELQKWISTGIQQFREFEIRIAEVSSILSKQGRDVLPSLEIGVVSLSKTYGVSINNLTKGLYEIISAAFNVKDAMYLLNVITKASIAGLTDIQGAVRTFTGVLNAYGMSVYNAQKLSDQLFTAVVRGNFTFDQLESALGYVVPIAAEAGVKFEEIASSMTTATRQGQHLDSVTRGLGLLIQNIVNPTKEAADAAKKYGIDMSAAKLRAEGLTGFLNDLAKATEKYGSQILPELIGNMRSLRVAMALTSKAGIKGFADDMVLMANATGRTNDALNQIMTTQQKLADVIEQNMQEVNRSVGEAWSGFDLWWKKTQVWWGTLFSRGNATKAVKDIDKRFAEIYSAAYMGTKKLSTATGGKSLFDQIFGGAVKSGTTIKGILSETNRLNDIKDYLDYTKQIESASKEITTLNNLKLGLNALINALKSSDFDKQYAKISKNARENFALEKYVDPTLLNELIEDMGKIDIKFETSGQSIGYYEGLLNKVNGRVTTLTDELELLKTRQEGTADTVSDVISAFRNAADEINEYKETIVTLEAEIKKLEEDVVNPFKGSEGKLRWEYAVKESEGMLDHFQHYAKLAMDYGDEFLNEWTDTVDDYGNSMQEVITTIYKYNQAQEEVKKITKEVEEANNELRIAMMRNNLEMLKIQYIGMVRRRGNTRAEQKLLKKLEIENTRLRIEEMKNQLKKQEEIAETSGDVTEEEYEEAKQIYERYVAYRENKLWELKDVYNEELQALGALIKGEAEELETRKTQLETAYTNLNTLQSNYIVALTEIARDPQLASAYKQLLGEEFILSAFQSYKDYLEFVAKNPIPEGVTEVTPPTGVRNVPQTILDAIEEYEQMGTPAAKAIAERLRQQWGIYQRGTHFIPETGFYMIHKGEQIVPSGKKVDAGLTIGNIIINVPVKTGANPKEIAYAISAALDSELVKYVGDKFVSKYKRR